MIEVDRLVSQIKRRMGGAIGGRGARGGDKIKKEKKVKNKVKSENLPAVTATPRRHAPNCVRSRGSCSNTLILSVGIEAHLFIG
jgi:hypothetical protein